MRIRLSHLVLLIGAFTLPIAVTMSAQLFTATPLNDLGKGTYESFQGGLYENGSNQVPAAHNADGLTFMSQVQPLDASGNPSSNGKVILSSLGMSNAQIEFSSFEAIANDSDAVNHTTLLLWSGAASGQDACYWFPAFGAPACSPTTENEYDRISDGLTDTGFSNLQVQAIWIDNANGRVHSENRGCQPQGTLCIALCDPQIKGCVNSDQKTNPLNEEEEFGETLRAAKTRFPDLKLAFFSSRVFGGYALSASDDADPEPFAYQTGFGIKWLIQAQINQISTGVVDPVAGDLSYGSAPWVAWGPYFWADGPIPRSDGLVWCNGQAGPPCNGEIDFSPPGLHLNTTGGNKAGNLLLDFFTTSPYTTPWFNN
jgi:hypothetical protein